MLEDGRYASVSDIARAEKIDQTYAGDILRLTLLAPAIVEAIVEGRHPVEMTLPVLMKPFAVEWEGQSAEACSKCEDSRPAPTAPRTRYQPSRRSRNVETNDFSTLKPWV